MTKGDEGEGKVNSGEESSVGAFHTDEQGAEGVEPSEGTLDTKALLVEERIKKAFAATDGCALVAGVASDIGNEHVIEAEFAERFGVKGAVGIEDGFVER